MKLFSRFTRRKAPRAPASFSAPLAPAETLAVIGDVHGCDRLLAKLLDQVAARAPDRLVFVGDYVDRGEDSAAVLARLHALAKDQSAPSVFLRGNHEEMMLRFLDDPAANGHRWLRYGGLQTLASYAIGGIGETPDPEQATRARDTLAGKIGPDRLAWLRACPTQFVSGNVAVVHAAADPAIPIAAQPEKTLIWGHPAFLKSPRSDGTWVVHGHTVMPRVEDVAGRIGVDTGAYATGRLSAALIGPGSLEVLTATY